MSFGNAKPESTTSKIEYSKAQQGIIDAASPVFQQYATSGGPKMPNYSAIAPFSENQLWAQNNAMSSAMGPLSDLSNQWAGNAAFLGGAAMSPDTNPFLRDTATAATRPIYEGLMEKILPTVRGEAVMNGMFGGSAQGIAEAGAIRDANRQVADTTSGIYSGAYENGQNRMLQMLGMSPTIAKGIASPASLADTVGQQQQQQQQSMLQEQWQKDLYAQMAPFLAARDAQAAGLASGTGTTNTYNPATPSTGQQVLGGFATLAGLFM